ncbi:MAG: golvesin C-terminal-like domain-containing protein, partial [Anaerolineae bacterium]
HLKDILVREGQVVERGQQIGTIGKMIDSQGQPTGPAHLHFEIRARRLPANAWNLERTEVLRSYLHPTDFIHSHRPGQPRILVRVERPNEGFFRSDSPHWFESPVGYGSRAYWTWTVGREHGEECFAEWRPKLPWPGLYEVFAFIPSQNATTQQACYEVHHRRGVSRVTIAQADFYDEWVSLGAYPFSTVQAAYVRLSDMTGEPYVRDPNQRKKIAFDAMMWVPVEMAPGRPLG